MPDELSIKRRALLQGILAMAGAASTASFSLGALAKVAKSDKQFLDDSAFATLSAVADTIIPVTDTPGALAAGVPANLDALLLNWAAPATREMIVASLGRIDKAARKEQAKAFGELCADERKAFLIEYDKAALKSVPLPPDAPKTHPFSPPVSVVDNGYHRIKDLVISLYYISEIGLTQELVYEHVPGAWVPSLKITPGMRPFASGGPI